MSAPKDPFNFAQFVPGFDFLKSLREQSTTDFSGLQPKMGGFPDFGNWIAPTFQPEEIDKRIQELKAVQFWLEQNSRVLAGTIQALEVQKMTLSALKDMNFSFPTPQKDKVQPTSATSAVKPSIPQTAEPPKKSSKKSQAIADATGNDPLQWWQALSQQFQEIAKNTMIESSKAMQTQNIQMPSTTSKRSPKKS